MLHHQCDATKVIILKSLLERIPLSRHDLIVLVAWPLINAIVIYSSLSYVMSVLDRPQLAVLLYRAPMAIFAACGLFWALRQFCDRKFSVRFNNQLLYAVCTNLVLMSIASVFATLLIPKLLSIDLASNLQLSRLKILTYLYLLLQVTIYTTVIHTLRLKQKGIELEMALKQSEIALLRAQTNPHFLFNTLNLLHNEIPQRPELAQELIFELSDLLRGTIAITGKKRIALNDEIELIKHYLSIQKARFNQRLSVTIDIAPSSKNLDIPPMLIMPLVENVIKHAVSNSNQTIELSVKTQYQNHQLSIRVSNSWPESTLPTFTSGSGLSNIIDTLNLEYQHANFAINFADRSTQAVITINQEFNGAAHL